MMSLSNSVRSARALKATPRNVSMRATDRPVFYPGQTPPAHLDGSMPCDYGFDPLSLGSWDKGLAWNRQAELQHCRWAMLGVVGTCVPDLLGLPMWADAGKESYFTDAFTLFTSQLLFMSWAEYRRWIDIQYPGSVNEDPIFGNYTVGEKGVGYPGGKWFDPMNFAKDEKKFLELQKKEIANGRLAMVAILGIAAQTYYTGKGPLVCLGEHIKNGVNIFS
ncbi:chlorophyll a-b binding protein [Pycnococcus provasolii]|uniref:Chlorophyll a-b binding protein, chloroplastic n=1 Tax=Pycnococcus provasolii TaxID=41880 RepID=A0A830HLA8_9CHLO|nr:chlorophyll a-b binding protein [Pycnococcus provasolii]|eukprot:CAMPEP_0119195436 /NCGR_PEP_ID=MMETSP1316-20130426/5998_1 /TAXON_ID=41880 /ORGANISM="Pycnococcus provasolii, Strain RCC2336" /LENGTH=219 /DNA_ID=CAMNT_0007190933 /DNA_START=1 /DNA_END=660 /DNA_ORIENTATION=+